MYHIITLYALSILQVYWSITPQGSWKKSWIERRVWKGSQRDWSQMQGFPSSTLASPAPLGSSQNLIISFVHPLAPYPQFPNRSISQLLHSDKLILDTLSWTHWTIPPSSPKKGFKDTVTSEVKLCLYSQLWVMFGASRACWQKDRERENSAAFLESTLIIYVKSFWKHFYPMTCSYFSYPKKFRKVRAKCVKRQPKQREFKSFMSYNICGSK